MMRCATTQRNTMQRTAHTKQCNTKHLLSSSHHQRVGTSFYEKIVLSGPIKKLDLGFEGEEEGLARAVKMVAHVRRAGQESAEDLFERRIFNVSISKESKQEWHVLTLLI